MIHMLYDNNTEYTTKHSDTGYDADINNSVSGPMA